MTERRQNPLSGDWVLVSSGRLDRPWKGEVDPPPADARPDWSADCHLCPRNVRVGGARNPDYQGVFVFDNDFPALAGGGAAVDDGLLRARVSNGRCRVLCYSERHDASLGQLTPVGIRGVVDAWCRESDDLGRDFVWVQIFENRGSMMGASSPHPHGQIWATSHLPSIAEREDFNQRQYLTTHGRPLLVDYATRETAARERVVISSPHWLVVVPFWAAWPFETLVVPHRPLSSLPALSAAERDDLADVLARLQRGYDTLFDVQFPYSMGWHGTPRGEARHWQLHAHFFPPLLRSAAVRKHMVGFELLAEVQRDLTPEEAAARLRGTVSR